MKVNKLAVLSLMIFYSSLSFSDDCKGLCSIKKENKCLVKTNIVVTKGGANLMKGLDVKIEMDGALFLSSANHSQSIDLPCGHVWKVVATSEGVTRTRTFNTVPKTSNDIVIAMDK